MGDIAQQNAFQIHKALSQPPEDEEDLRPYKFYQSCLDVQKQDQLRYAPLFDLFINHLHLTPTFLYNDANMPNAQTVVE